MIKHISKQEQQSRFIFNEKFLENKPIPFPDFKKRYNYSNLFYWAHLEAFETATFPLHPHEGFEIMTFVLEGRIEHYDSATKIWTPIEAGAFQVIQSGRGVEHSEKVTKGTKAFQIWFDPDFSKTLKKQAAYKDYSKDFIKPTSYDRKKVYEYIGNSEVFHDTKDIQITKEYFEIGEHILNLDLDYIYSIYLISGTSKINNQQSITDDFFICEDEKILKIEVLKESELFIIKTPKNVLYKTV
jgi:quercetin 2,3-dioxygenase